MREGLESILRRFVHGGRGPYLRRLRVQSAQRSASGAVWWMPRIGPFRGIIRTPDRPGEMTEGKARPDA